MLTLEELCFICFTFKMNIKKEKCLAVSIKELSAFGES